MPLFEYICTDCRKRFEALVYGSQEPSCPLCGSKKLEQQISTFAVGSSRSEAKAPCGVPAKAAAACGGTCGCGH